MSEDMVCPEMFGKDNGLIHEAIVTGRQIGAGKAFWSGLAHDKDFFREVLRLADKRGHADLINGIFISPIAQLDLVLQRNEQRKWGFSEKEFSRLGKPPAWPKGRLSAVVLDVSLETIEQTFEEAWHFASLVQPRNNRYDVLSDAAHLRLLPGITHRRGLRWVIVDLAANWDKESGVCPDAICDPKTSPGSAVFWAASYFPQWVRSMDGVNVPSVLIPGYQLSVWGGQPWLHLPGIWWLDSACSVRLIAYEAHKCYRRKALPVFQKSAVVRN